MRPGKQRIQSELLVLRCQEGSREAFRLLVQRWQEPLWRHARRLTGDDDSAWEVMQETWMAVTRGLGRLEDASRFHRWVFGIVTHRAADHFRRRAPGRLDESGTVAPRAEPDDRAARVREAMDRLPPDTRTILSLRHLEGFDLWEIAEILGIPEGTVKSRLHHARHALREILERSE